jgi:uncharacterized RDD family membrane protein YckC
MNLESLPSKKNPIVPKDELLMDDFDFKPITSGLGFHHPKTSDVKPAFERTLSLPVINPTTSHSFPKKEANVYQNDLSIFYGQQTSVPTPTVQAKAEKAYRLATKSERILAYMIDLSMVLSFLGIVLTVMARTISMDLMEVWTSFPNEITPLVVVLFIGFYMIYFPIFEKASGSTLGKNIVGLRVVDNQNSQQNFVSLTLRSFVSLLSFASLGLFAFFDLQNKISGSKVIRND